MVRIPFVITGKQYWKMNLKNFLRQTYPYVPAKILEQVKQEFLLNAGIDIHQRNHAFHLKLSKGISKTRKEKYGKRQFEHFYLVNYNEVDKNDFMVKRDAFISY